MYQHPPGKQSVNPAMRSAPFVPTKSVRPVIMKNVRSGAMKTEQAAASRLPGRSVAVPLSSIRGYSTTLRPTHSAVRLAPQRGVGGSGAARTVPMADNAPSRPNIEAMRRPNLEVVRRPAPRQDSTFHKTVPASHKLPLPQKVSASHISLSASRHPPLHTVESSHVVPTPHKRPPSHAVPPQQRLPLPHTAPTFSTTPRPHSVLALHKAQPSPGVLKSRSAPRYTGAATRTLSSPKVLKSRSASRFTGDVSHVSSSSAHEDVSSVKSSQPSWFSADRQQPVGVREFLDQHSDSRLKQSQSDVPSLKVNGRKLTPSSTESEHHTAKKTDAAKTSSSNTDQWFSCRTVSAPFYAFTSAASALPFDILFTPPFSLKEPSLCEAVGPALVVETLRTSALPSEEQDNGGGAPTVLKFRQNDSKSTRIASETPVLSSGQVQTTLPQIKGFGIVDEGLRTATRFAAQEELRKTEGIQVVYVHPIAFPKNARDLLGERSPTLFSVFMTTWISMMTTGKEQVLSILGNPQPGFSLQQSSEASKLLTAAVYVGGLPLSCRPKQLEIIRASDTCSIQVLRSLSSLLVAGTPSQRSITKWALGFDATGTLTDIRLISRLLDTLHNGGSAFGTLEDHACVDDLSTGNLRGCVPLYHATDLALSMLFSCSSTLQAYAIADHGRSQEVQEKQQQALRSWLRPLWKSTGGQVGDASWLSTGHTKQDKEALAWIQALETLGLSETQVKCFVRYLLVGALLLAPTSSTVPSWGRGAQFEPRPRSPSGLLSKSDLMGAMMGLAQETLTHFFEDGCELLGFSFARSSILANAFEQTDAREQLQLEQALHFRLFSLLHRQLYAWLCHIVEQNLRSVTPCAESIAESTNQFGTPHRIFILDGPSNVDPTLDRSFGTFACSVAQCLLECQAFEQVCRLRFFLRSQGIVGRLDTRVLGAYETAEAIDEGPGADDVALSCACGLFCYGASNHRSTKDIMDWIGNMREEKRSHDYASSSASRVFTAIDKTTRQRETVSFRFGPLATAFQWSVASLEDATLPQSDIAALWLTLLAKSSLSRILHWQQLMEPASSCLNEFDRCVKAIHDTIQPLLGLPTCLILPGTSSREAHGAYHVPYFMRLAVLWERHGWPLWIPLEMFCTQFHRLIAYTDSLVQEPKHSAKSFVTFIQELSSLFPHPDHLSSWIKDYRCGTHGVLITARLCRYLYACQQWVLCQTPPVMQQRLTGKHSARIRNPSSESTTTELTSVSGTTETTSQSPVTKGERSKTFSKNMLQKKRKSDQHQLIRLRRATRPKRKIKSKYVTVPRRVLCPEGKAVAARTLEQEEPALRGKTLVHLRSGTEQEESLKGATALDGPGIPWRFRTPKRDVTPMTAEKVRQLLRESTTQSETVKQLLELTDETLLNMFRTNWKQVSVSGSWRGLVYCSKEAAEQLEHLGQLQDKLGTRPAARNVSETIKNFIAGFCEPLESDGQNPEDTALRLLLCHENEDLQDVARNQTVVFPPTEFSASGTSHLKILSPTGTLAERQTTTMEGNLNLDVSTRLCNKKPVRRYLPKNRALDRLKVRMEKKASDATSNVVYDQTQQQSESKPEDDAQQTFPTEEQPITSIPSPEQ